MSDDKKAQVDSETILMTLDQIGQTIDIMTNVVGRLRGYITEQVASQETEKSSETESIQLTEQQGQTVH